jgi:hypothetical protein
MGEPSLWGGGWPPTLPRTATPCGIRRMGRFVLLLRAALPLEPALRAAHCRVLAVDCRRQLGDSVQLGSFSCFKGFL